ncbi:hypothetical protein JTB14_005832 [Gonioctena quinquepunctata]|nr:hypothetical protein JTB14_005832 [Gonioctena quinquepunctata]
MLETPYKDFPKTTRNKKAINSKALIVKKVVFPTKTTKSSEAKEAIAKTKDQTGRTKHKESWYCKACQEDVKKDMRLCSVCLVYYHEECVGLTKADKTVFIRSDCC